MASPTVLPNLNVYRTDPVYTLTIKFKDENKAPIDVSGSTFIPTMADGYIPSVDMTSANLGIIYLGLESTEMTEADQSVLTDLFETPLWNKVILRWVFTFEDGA